MISFCLILKKGSNLIGGQALHNGVMFRDGNNVSVAIRCDDGFLKVEKLKASKFLGDSFLSIAVFRGLTKIIRAIIDGYRVNTWAMFESENKNNAKKLSRIEIIVIAIIALSTIFILGFAPYFFIEKFNNSEPLYNNPLWYNFVRKIVQTLLIIIFFIMSTKILNRTVRNPSITQYHGAEHKVINAYENKLEISVNKVRSCSTYHLRCGTNLLINSILLGTILFSFIDAIYIHYFGSFSTVYIRMIVHIFAVPISLGLGYEFLIYFSKRLKISLFGKLLDKLRRKIQSIIAKEPSEKQLEVAIAAMKNLIDSENNYKNVDAN